MKGKAVHQHQNEPKQAGFNQHQSVLKVDDHNHTQIDQERYGRPKVQPVEREELEQIIE